MGDFVLSGSHDRSIRRWNKSDEVFFLEEEKEKRLERILDANDVVRNPDAFSKQGDDSCAVPVPSKSQVCGSMLTSSTFRSSSSFDPACQNSIATNVLLIASYSPPLGCLMP